MEFVVHEDSIGMELGGENKKLTAISELLAAISELLIATDD